MKAVNPFTLSPVFSRSEDPVMNRELVLNFKFGDSGSAREVRDFGQAMEYTGKNTEETAGELDRLQA